MTLTTERLKDLTFHRSKLIFPASHEEAAAMARELLANREAQPVAEPDYIRRDCGCCGFETLNDYDFHDGSVCPKCNHKPLGKTELYTAPPAPAVPPEATPENIENLLADITLFFTAGSLSHGGAVMFAEVWNACRAAMLNHVGETNEKADAKCECSSIDYCKNCLRAMLAQPVSSGYKLPPHVYRELVNCLRDTAVKYQGAQQLRAQLSRTLTENGLVASAPEGGNGHDTRR